VTTQKTDFVDKKPTSVSPHIHCQYCTQVAKANDRCDQLISDGHTDAPTIALWKDSLNEAWENLLELIDTRTQALEASRQMHKFFYDCRDCLARILEKTHSLPDELGRDSSSVGALSRKHLVS
jgi:spectrin beta